MNGELYCIKSQKLASYLMNKGFRLIKMDKDKNNPKRNVFLFKISDDLLCCITKFTKKNNKNNK